MDLLTPSSSTDSRETSRLLVTGTVMERTRSPSTDHPPACGISASPTRPASHTTRSASRRREEQPCRSTACSACRHGSSRGGPGNGLMTPDGSQGWRGRGKRCRALPSTRQATRRIVRRTRPRADEADEVAGRTMSVPGSRWGSTMPSAMGGHTGCPILRDACFCRSDRRVDRCVI